jgi:hypothetical protein
MKKLLKSIIDWVNEPVKYEYENELEFLSESVDHADLEHKISEIQRVQRYRTNIALGKGYL